MGNYNDFCNEYLTPLNKDANRLPNWTFSSVTQLANGYIEEENRNQTKASHYFSALMCKYWGLIQYFNKTKGVSYEDGYDWIVDGLLKGLQYRRWQDPNFEVSKEPDGAKKVFNRCIWSVMNAYYKQLNREYAKINSMTTSLEGYIESNGLVEDFVVSTSLYDDGVDEYDKLNSEMLVEGIINNYLKQDQVFKAMVVDIICYQNAFKDENKPTEKFSKPIVVRNFNKMKSEDYYLNYFCDRYKVDFNATKELVLNKLNGRCNNTISVWLNKLIDKTLNELKHNKGLMENYVD